MSPRAPWERRRLLLRVAAIALVGSVLLSCGGDDGTTGQGTPPADLPVVHPDGVGALEVGMAIDEAEATGLLGEIAMMDGSEPCLTGGSAPLVVEGVSRAGTVILTETEVEAVRVFSPEMRTEEGVGVGSTLVELDEAFGSDATVAVDDSRLDLFELRVATVTYDGQSRSIYEFALDLETEEVTSIGIPGSPPATDAGRLRPRQAREPATRVLRSSTASTGRPDPEGPGHGPRPGGSSPRPHPTPTPRRGRRGGPGRRSAGSPAAGPGQALELELPPGRRRPRPGGG